MIDDKSLENRLNAVKNGNPLPPPPSPQQPLFSTNKNKYIKFTLNAYIISKIFILLDSSLASFLYGFAIKTIFGTDWSLFGAFTVGFLFNHAISIFPKVLFPKLFK